MNATPVGSPPPVHAECHAGLNLQEEPQPSDPPLLLYLIGTTALREAWPACVSLLVWGPPLTLCPL